MAATVIAGGLDNDVRGWIMAIVSGIGEFKKKAFLVLILRSYSANIYPSSLCFRRQHHLRGHSNPATTRQAQLPHSR
jgi:hypothetical protein